MDPGRGRDRCDGGAAVPTLPDTRSRLRAVGDWRRAESPCPIQIPARNSNSSRAIPRLALRGPRTIVAAVEAFVAREIPADAPATVLGTVLFTDIVGSTERQAAAGDRAWADLIRRHHTIVREALERWRGVENDTAGDGFYATFDWPARAIRCALDVVTSIGRHRARGPRGHSYR